MIRWERGDIFESGCDALVCPVNTVGTWGAGLALAFKKKFPAAYRQHHERCMAGGFAIGDLDVWRDPAGDADVISLPTKTHWRDPSRLEYVDAGVRALRRLATASTWRAIAVPALGCGLGGLPWHEVQSVLAKLLDPVPGIDFRVYEPQ